MKPKQPPSVGRIVHYYYPGLPGRPLAAIITEVEEGYNDVCLSAFHPLRGPDALVGVAYSETPKAGHWSYPPHVAPKT